ncbi:MAG TPA: hypothetical protein VFN55_01185 [Solirubrobacteraceae bacterium]|nr:hypothetical protein [Solirubrobacteraceae bacterium]
MLDGGSRTPVPARGGRGGRVRLRRLAARPERRSGRAGFRVPPHAGQRGADGAGGTPPALLQAALFALAVALAGFTILEGIAPHDEGLMLQAGARIASGQWPYQDFWMNYPPGQPLVLALLQRAFGPSLLSWRILLLAVDGLVSVLAWRLARRRAGEIWALAAWLAVAGAMAYPALPGPNPLALAFGLGALLAARERPALGGVLAGLACLLRIEFGLATIIAVALTAPPGRRLRSAAWGTGVAILAFAPFVAVAPHALWADTFGFYGIQSLQRLPFPLSFSGPLRPSKLIEFYIPLILVAGVAVWAAAMATTIRSEPPNAAVSLRGGLAARTRLRGPGREAWSLVPLAVIGLGYLLGRTDEFHLVPLAVVLPVMLAWAGAAARGRPVQIAVAVALGLICVHGLERRAGQALHPPAGAAVPGPAGDGVSTDPADAAALRALRAELGRLTRPGEPIFVANPRFDVVTAGDPLLYVITGHPNPTRYDVMQPGVVTTAPVQREIIRELAGTRVVIRWLDPRATLRQADGAAHSSGVHLLDRWLAAHFRPVARYGVYGVLVRDRSPRG